MQYADLALAALGAFALAWITDLLTGRRGLGAASLVAAVGAACGCFLAIRVFAVATLADWIWVVWALAGATLCLAAYVLFRNKR